MAKPKVVLEVTDLVKNYCGKPEKVKHRVVRKGNGEYCIETLNLDVMGGKRWEQVKTEENQKREDAKTAGAIGRARIKEATHNKTSRQPGQGQIEDGCPHGAPVADMVV